MSVLYWRSSIANTVTKIIPLSFSGTLSELKTAKEIAKKQGRYTKNFMSKTMFCVKIFRAHAIALELITVLSLSLRVKVNVV